MKKLMSNPLRNQQNIFACTGVKSESALLGGNRMSQQKQEHTYRSILRENKSFRNLFYALSVSTLGDWFYNVALMGLMYARTNSPFMVSLILLSGALPRLLFSPLVGAFIDRFNKKKIMVLTDFIRGTLIVFMILLANHLVALFIIVILNSIAGIFFNPSRQAVLPGIVKKEQLAVANSLSNVVYGVTGIFGASLGGVVSALFTYKAAFLINSISFFLSATLVFFTFIPDLKDQVQKREPYFKSIIEGYKFILRSKIVFSLVFAGLSWGLVGGAYQVLIVIYGAKVFHAGDFGIGLLYSGEGLGMLIGSLLVAKYFSTNTEQMIKVFGWSYLVQGTFFLFFILSGHLLLGVIFVFMMYIAGGIITPLDSTLIQTFTPQNLLGRVFTFHTATYSSLMQLSIFTTGLLLEWQSPQVIGIVFGILCLIVSFYWMIMYYKNKFQTNFTHEL